MTSQRTIILIAPALCLFATATLAHIELQGREARIDSSYRAVFQVPHGCSGSPTVKLRIQIPAGVIDVKPVPKAGWQLDTVTAKFEKPFTLNGTEIAEGVKEIAWTGKLRDGTHDTFVISTYLTDGLQAGRTLYFPVVQECETGVNRWIEIPADGKSAHDLKETAPGVKLLPKAEGH
jgi:periplasmic copper chaperone A